MPVWNVLLTYCFECGIRTDICMFRVRLCIYLGLYNHVSLYLFFMFIKMCRCLCGCVFVRCLLGGFVCVVCAFGFRVHLICDHVDLCVFGVSKCLVESWGVFCLCIRLS